MAGKIVKARNELERIQEVVRESSKELSANQQKLTIALQECETVKSDILTLEGKSKKLDEKILAGKEVLKNIDIDIKKASDAVGDRKDTVNSLEKTIKEKERLIENLIAKVAILEGKESSVEKSLEGLTALKESMNNDIQELLGKQVDIGHSISNKTALVELLENKEKNIQSSLSEAQEEFSLFERRMSDFAQETGFIIKYKKPST